MKMESRLLTRTSGVLVMNLTLYTIELIHT